MSFLEVLGLCMLLIMLEADTRVLRLFLFGHFRFVFRVRGRTPFPSGTEPLGREQLS